MRHLRKSFATLSGLAVLLGSTLETGRPADSAVVSPELAARAESRDFAQRWRDAMIPARVEDQVRIVPEVPPLPPELETAIPAEAQPSATLEAEARQYLASTACPGDTMTRQGPELAIGRLHPVLAVRLMRAISEVRAGELPEACIFSAYRPPAFGVGGYANKFNSLHSYGLAVDMRGIGAPGSSQAVAWYAAAHRNGLYVPYGPRNRVEWNHTQLIPIKGRAFVAENPIRDTVTANGPIDLVQMWNASTVPLDQLEPAESSEIPPVAAAGSRRLRLKTARGTHHFRRVADASSRREKTRGGHRLAVGRSGQTHRQRRAEAATHHHRGGAG